MRGEVKRTRNEASRTSSFLLEHKSKALCQLEMGLELALQGRDLAHLAHTGCLVNVLQWLNDMCRHWSALIG